MYYFNSTEDPPIDQQRQIYIPVPSPPLHPTPKPSSPSQSYTPESNGRIAPTPKEYDDVLEHLFDDSWNPKGDNCTIGYPGKSNSKWEGEIKGCPSVDFARLEGNSIHHSCKSTLRYTFRDHHLNSPIDYPILKGVDRTFYETKQTKIEWPINEEYIELRCESQIQYFARILEKKGLLQSKLKAIQRLDEAALVPKDAPNILIVMVDSVSASQAIQLFPETMKFLKTVNKSPSHRLFSFNRLNSPDHSLTISNLTPLFAGLPWNARKLDEFRVKTFIYSLNYTDVYKRGPIQPPFLWDYLKDLGYVTFFGSLANNMMGTRYWNSTFDHLIPAISNWAGDPPTALKEFMYLYDPIVGPCLGGKYSFSHLLDWTEDMMTNRYNGARKFGFVHLLEAHRNPTNAMRTADVPLRNFLQKMMDVPNTVIYFASDHGPPQFDRRLPFLRLFMPIETLRPEVERNLFTNQFRLISHFDMHETLKHMVVGQTAGAASRVMRIFGPKKTVPEVQSIFEEVPPRQCSSIGIIAPSCVCAKWTGLPATHPGLNKLVQHILNVTNGKLIEGCIPLTLSKITSASETKIEGETSLFYSGGLVTKEGSPDPATFIYEGIAHQNGTFSSLHFRQTSTYSTYNVCRPPGADLHTCICNPKASEKSKRSITYNPYSDINAD